MFEQEKQRRLSELKQKLRQLRHVKPEEINKLSDELSPVLSDNSNSIEAIVSIIHSTLDEHLNQTEIEEIAKSLIALITLGGRDQIMSCFTDD